MVKRVIAALALSAGCATAAMPIVPARLEAPLATYEVEGRSVAAAPGGQAKWSSEDAELAYGDDVKVSVMSVAFEGMAMSERNLASALHRIKALEGRPLLKEESPGLALFCMESAPSDAAACARVSEDKVVVIVTFAAPAATFRAMGGTRLAAEVARSAKGFRPARPLPSQN